MGSEIDTSGRVYCLTKKKIGPMSLASLAALQSQIIVSCNGTSWSNSKFPHKIHVMLRCHKDTEIKPMFIGENLEYFLSNL